MVGEEIIQEIDATLDLLIQNAEALQNTNMQELSTTEIEAFQKTQESLIHHLLHMDQRLEAKKRNLQIPNQRSGTQKIKEKLHRFETLKSAYHKRIAETAKEQTIPILSKRKHKRFFSRSQ